MTERQWRLALIAGLSSTLLLLCRNRFRCILSIDHQQAIPYNMAHMALVSKGKAAGKVAKPLLSTSSEEARKRVLNLYRAWMREVSDTLYLFPVFNWRPVCRGWHVLYFKVWQLHARDFILKGRFMQRRQVCTPIGVGIVSQWCRSIHVPIVAKFQKIECRRIESAAQQH